ncbi:MAG: YciI family protein [Bacillota bacterium]
MQYLLLIYTQEAEYAAMDKKATEALSAEYGAFTQGIVKSGHFKGGERLRPTDMATTVRVKNGKTVTTDGPFAETREQLGGFYLIEAKDLDEANGIAARIPAARHGSIEVRPIWAMGAA